MSSISIYIPVQLIQLISDFLDFETNLKLSQINKEIRNNIQIKYVNNSKITDSILRQFKYKKIVRLNAFNNPKIKKIGHMKNLQELDAGENCGVSDDSIQELNLKILNAHDNPKITKIII